MTNELNNLIEPADLARELQRFIADPTSHRYKHITGVQSAQTLAYDMATRQQLALDIVAVLSRPLIRDAARADAARARARARAEKRRRKTKTNDMIDEQSNTER